MLQGFLGILRLKGAFFVPQIKVKISPGLSFLCQWSGLLGPPDSNLAGVLFLPLSPCGPLSWLWKTEDLL